VLTTTLEIPATVDGIDTDWLTSALSTRYPGTVVTAMHHGRLIQGTGTKRRVLLEYNEAGHMAGLPATMWIKGGFDGVHNHIMAGGNAAEAIFFNQVAPSLDANIPRCYYAATEGPAGRSIVLLEDLLNRNVTFGRATRPLSVDAVRGVLDMQASYHARWWNRDSEQLDGVETGAPWLRGAIMHLLNQDNWDELIGRRSDIIPASLRDRARVVAASEAWFEWEKRGTHTLLHGDLHLGNMFFERDGRPGVLDWQVVNRGQFTHDFTYSMVSALTVADRCAHGDDLLRYYLGRLAAHGVSSVPTFEEAFLAHRRDLMHGFWWAVTPSTMQPEDICRVTTERFAAAADDLDMLGALESI
jgi:Phosphotransferase enzyme family